MEDFATPPETGDAPAPILLGEAPADFAAPPADFAAPPADFAAPPGDFAAPPADFAAPPPAEDAFLGTVDETPAPEGDAPIILGGEPPEEEPVEEEPEEPAGPSPMQKWNEEWQQTLLERKNAENDTKAEYIKKAEEYMKTFNEQREQKREAKISKNRQDEQAKLEAIEADLEIDNSWQRVCKMVELSHDSAEKAADVKRMRDTMILLKNDTAKATVLA